MKLDFLHALIQFRFTDIKHQHSTKTKAALSEIAVSQCSSVSLAKLPKQDRSRSGTYSSTNLYIGICIAGLELDAGL